MPVVRKVQFSVFQSGNCIGCQALRNGAKVLLNEMVVDCVVNKRTHCTRTGCGSIENNEKLVLRTTAHDCEQ